MGQLSDSGRWQRAPSEADASAKWPKSFQITYDTLDETDIIIMTRPLVAYYFLYCPDDWRSETHGYPEPPTHKP